MASEQTNSGSLYIVAGPIGNLNDITIRALDILKTTDLVISEDTRETSKLFDHFEIKAQQISYRDQNHDKVYGYILDVLKSGKNVALVSDCGTPLISDPGFKLVRDLRAEGVTILAVPGPSAVISALSVSGLPTDKFTFLGFLPRGPGQRSEILRKYGSLDSTLIIYESPYRISKLLLEIQTVLGSRTVCLSRELTKLHEETITAPVEDLLEKYRDKTFKGEFVVLISKAYGSKNTTTGKK